MLNAAHQQLGGPAVPVWDIVATHVSRSMQELIAARSWLTVYQLPPYAPELNPVEGMWSHLKRMQYRPGLIEGLIAKTGLDLHPPNPRL
ncbi:transposase [Streptomyces pseudovenezuelae]|uniref:transposase n=1 Tax=Streptomyces pseudovenezuelae TaxID=67350 RepID=UPI002E81E1C1|nr:transposase [Streptomyces pseudovenezuelae]WUA94268.1 transposase [Streptomyces pseudovenezuelae]